MPCTCTSLDKSIFGVWLHITALSSLKVTLERRDMLRGGRVPLTDTFESNSLYCESAPGKGDFHCFKLSYGSFMRFYGNQCMHYTVPNTTESTRVSLDFRVVPGPLFEHNPEYSRMPDGTPRFAVGGYYKECCIAADGRSWTVC